MDYVALQYHLCLPLLLPYSASLHGCWLKDCVQRPVVSVSDMKDIYPVTIQEVSRHHRAGVTTAFTCD